MFNSVKSFLLKLLKVPPEPEDPMGDVDSLRVFRASYNYFRYKFYIWLVKNIVSKIIALFVIVFVFIFISSALPPPLGIALGLLAAAAIFLFSVLHLFFSYIVLRLDYEMRWYKVSDRSLRIREGVIFVKEQTMTFANIQNISVTQGPIQRLFNIADLKVESAGGGGSFAAQQGRENGLEDSHTAYFRGVDNAAEISDMMKERLKKLRDGGLGDLENLHKQEASAIEALPESRSSLAFIVPMLKELNNEAIKFKASAKKLALCGK